jgi:tRNA pseudouridine55 synthase
MRGFLNIDKPGGITSFDVVRAVRRASGVKRVGHAGTLDPLATGVLAVAIGDATRLIDAMMETRKRYRAEVTFGAETDTDDAEGAVTVRGDLDVVRALTTERVAAALATFEGERWQTPPAYSAIKQAGVPAYRAARRGEIPTLAARRVEAGALRLLKFENASGVIEIECSKGYYVRSLARDLGRALSVGAHVRALRRTAVGPFTVERATPLDEVVARLTAARSSDGGAEGDLDTLLHAPDAVLTAWPALLLDADEVAELRFGRTIAPPLVAAAPTADVRVRAYAPDGLLAAIVSYRASESCWRPLRVFAPETATTEPAAP